MTITVAVLDDEKNSIDMMVKIINDFDESTTFEIDTYLHSYDFLKSNIEYNIAFIDVELDEDVDGFYVAKKYKQIYRDTLIVFVTSHEELSTEGYIVDAFRYVFKRNIEEKMKEALKSAVFRIKKEKMIEFDVVHIGKIIVPVKNICYLENELRNNRLHVNERNYLIKGNVEKYKEQLKEYEFICPHRSYLVNPLWVKEIKGSNIILMNNESVPLSRLKKTEIARQILIYKSKWEW